MKDVMLISLIAMAEAETPMEQDVTLIVGGFLISGFVVSYKKYCEHSPITSGINNALDEVTASDIEPPEKTYNFIHLRDAKYYHTSGNPIPGNTGVFVRIPLESIHGFSLGKLVAETR